MGCWLNLLEYSWHKLIINAYQLSPADIKYDVAHAMRWISAFGTQRYQCFSGAAKPLGRKQNTADHLILSSTALTLLVLPILYRLAHLKEEELEGRRELDLGVETGLEL